MRTNFEIHDMHANWQNVRGKSARELFAECFRRGGSITPYASRKGCRSWIVSWSSDGAEGQLYVVRLWAIKKQYLALTA